MKYILEKPKASSKDSGDLLDYFFDSTIMKAASSANQYGRKKEYLYWTDVKRKKSMILKNISPEDFWQLVKINRKISSKPCAIQSMDGNPFTWVELPKLGKFLHDMDMHSGGALRVGTTDIDGRNKNAFLFKGIMEEAIASSQLEGANVTREQAKKFLREKRKPRTRGEEMILNNYETIRKIEEEYRKHDMSMELLLEMHQMLTVRHVTTGKADRLRRHDEKYEVADEATNIVYHIAPPMKFVEKELKRLIDFANDTLDTTFTHPVIKAIMLHFWIGYLHPFTDGNGRLARAIFYWYLSKKDYWAMSYLPISTVIRTSWKEYGMAYVFSEQDDNDLTYFIDYNIRKIEIAMRNFEEHCTRISAKNSQLYAIASTYGFNDRQIRLLQYLQKGGGRETTASWHMNENQVSKPTAIRDLKELEAKGLIRAQKRGRNKFYSGMQKIDELMRT